MTLMEVVVAMSIFTVLAATSIGLLVRTTGVARDNVSRTQAVDLATAAIEMARSQDATQIPSGLTVTTKKVGGQTYTIRQTANYVPTDSSTSICTSNSSSLAYKLVTVRVTWPNMSPGIQPVREDTLKAVGVGAIDSSTGTLAVLVSGAYGAAISGVTVTLSDGSTQTTGDDGCAVFTGLAPGTSYTASANAPGYTGTANTQAASSSAVSMAANTVTRATLNYDTQRTATVALDAPATAVVPSNLPIRYADSAISETSFAVCASNPTATCIGALPTGVAQVLYPAVYTFKAGTCAETTPSSVAYDLRTAAANGGTATIPVAAPTITVKTLAGTVVSGRAITITHAAATGCTSGETYTATSTATGGVQVALPYGTWTLTCSGLSVAVATTLSGTNKTPAITLTVIA